MSKIALNVLVCSNNSTSSSELAGDVRVAGGPVAKVVECNLDVDEVAAAIQEHGINVIVLTPLLEEDGLVNSGALIQKTRQRFPEVRYILCGNREERERRKSEFVGELAPLWKFFWLDVASDYDTWRTRISQQLDRVKANLEVKHGITLVDRLAVASGIPESAWRLLLVVIVLGFGLAGFFFLPTTGRALIWLLFFILALPLALSFFAAEPMASPDLVKMYEAGVKAIPFIGRLFSQGRGGASNG